MKKVILIILLLCCICTPASAEGTDHLFSTGRIMEIDRCASAWLIKRYIDPDAVFIFFEEGELITRGVAFDTPDARFSRTHNLATLEVLMRHYDIKDPKLAFLSSAIHDIEINFWAGHRENRNISDLDMNIKNIIHDNPDPEQCLQKCFLFFDQLIGQTKK